LPCRDVLGTALSLLLNRDVAVLDFSLPSRRTHSWQWLGGCSEYSRAVSFARCPSPRNRLSQSEADSSIPRVVTSSLSLRRRPTPRRRIAALRRSPPFWRNG